MALTSTKFSKRIIELLRDAGWYEGRQVSVKDLKLPYDDYPKKAIEFLKEFGKLTGTCRTSNKDEQYKFIIEPELEDRWLYEEKEYPYYQDLLEKKLYPIGMYPNEAYYICCDKDCRVYLIGEYCFFHGNNLYEGLDSIIRIDHGKILQLDEENTKWWNRESKYVELPPLD